LRRLPALIVSIVAGCVLFYSTLFLPPWGDPYQPASVHVSPRYIEKTLEETAVPNAVTSILADYRGYDTLFETSVIFTAGIAVMMLLRRGRRSVKGQGSFVVRTASRILVPFMQVYSLYVFAHGHSSPGGGFQGGCVMAASFILLAIVYDINTAKKWLKEKATIIFCALGVFIYAGTGLPALFFGANFLDYGTLSRLLPTDPVKARYFGIALVELGVQITVMAVMVSIFSDLLTKGKHGETKGGTDG
jgi:multicomponent Na+:H+ antiporter subunit B